MRNKTTELQKRKILIKYKNHDKKAKQKNKYRSVFQLKCIMMYISFFN